MPDRSGASHDRGDDVEANCRKIIRNIAAHTVQNMPAIVCVVGIITFVDTMSLNHHATVTHLCGHPHAWYRGTNTIYCRCLTPLSIGNDTNICPTCLLAAYQRGWWSAARGTIVAYAKL